MLYIPARQQGSAGQPGGRMASWIRPQTWGKSLEQQQQDREQRWRDARAEARAEYLADMSDGYESDD